MPPRGSSGEEYKPINVLVGVPRRRDLRIDACRIVGRTTFRELHAHPARGGQSGCVFHLDLQGHCHKDLVNAPEPRVKITFPIWHDQHPTVVGGLAAQQEPAHNSAHSAEDRNEEKGAKTRAHGLPAPGDGPAGRGLRHCTGVEAWHTAPNHGGEVKRRNCSEGGQDGESPQRRVQTQCTLHALFLVAADIRQHLSEGALHGVLANL
mmetsp:Transcript_57456/g.186640  ORF Transcript_57456/g.186640 Transcript_57456/m.186640 type:complete len:207 (+) Transcript_57456:1151-1771(+)